MGRRPLCVCLLFFLTVFLAGSLSKTSEAGGQNLNGQPVRLYGIVEEIYEPLERSEDTIILYLNHVKILTPSVNDLSEKNKQNIEGAVCYLSDEQIPLRVGAKVQVAGTAYTFQGATNPGEFDVASYYELRGYQLKIYDAYVEKQSASYDRMGQFFHKLRMEIARTYDDCLGEKNGALASAMVLGRKKDIDDTVEMLYQSAGISHILAISGLHVSLVGSCVVMFLKRMRLPLWAACVIAILFILGYGIFTGLSVSTLRAVIMFLLVMTAQIAHRTSDTFTSLTVAATAVLVQEPGYLYDSGFQLSFSAVAGMAIVVPVLKDRGLRRPEKPTLKKKCLDWAWDGFSTSFGVALAMMPFMLAHFYTWNPWSLIYNPAAIFITGLLLPQLFVLAGTGLVLGKLAAVLPALQDLLLMFMRILALPSGIFFSILENGSSLIQKLPGSCLHIGMPQIWQLVLFTAGLLLQVAFGKLVRPGMRLILAAGLVCIFLIRLPQNLTITMLDVGQGAGFVVQTPDDQTYLCDAGSTSKSGVGEYQIVPFLKYSGVDRLEAIFVSHWDEDHVNGLADIFEWAQWEHVEIGCLILPEISLEDEALKELLDLANNYGVGVKRMGAGDLWEKDGIQFTSLHPYEGEAAVGRNAASLVLKLEYGSFAAMFPGDLEEDQEKWLCENYDEKLLSCQLLAAGHHGSSTSSSEAFLDAVDPAAALISCGEKNRYGHPHKEVLVRFKERGISWYMTPYEGAVSVEVDETKMRIQGFVTDGGG